MVTINERILKIRKDFGYTQAEMAEKIDVAPRTYVRYEGGDRDIPSSVLIKIAKLGKIDMNWLISGDVGQKEAIVPGGGYSIDVLDVRAGAGTGVYNYSIEVVDHIVMDKAFFKATPNLSKVKIIEVDGDSMEPLLHDGAYVVIDETKTDRVNGIYAIHLDGQLLIKRLQFMMDGRIKIISDNPQYETEIYDPSDSQLSLTIIGRKVLTVQR